MATTEKMKSIFLSASIPLPERDEKYIGTADIIAIRDAVIALTTVVLPHHRLIWGGHPSITPLIYYVMERLNLNIQEHITLYQSRFFEKYFPEDNNKFENIVKHPKALVLPIASTGAGAKKIYDERFTDNNERLVKDYAYMSLFQKYLIDKI